MDQQAAVKPESYEAPFVSDLEEGQPSSVVAIQQVSQID
jgi:hypothetical protein